MTDTLELLTPSEQPPPPPPRRNPALTALAAVAVAAVVALAIVTVVAVNRAADHQSSMMADSSKMSSMMSQMMGDGSMMGHDQMSSSQMTGGSMMSNGQMMGGSMMGRAATSSTIAGAREIAVTAAAFAFEPAEIHVRTGEDATIVLTATDLAHDFTVDELGIHVAATPGQAGRGSFHAPSTAGRYMAYCSVAGHRAAGMIAMLVVDAG